MAEEKTLSSKIIYTGRAIQLRVDTVRMPSGRETTRDVVEHTDCIAVIPIDDKENVLLVRQFRQAPSKTLLEIPADGIDPGEDAETAVRREMQEETGYLPHKLERLLSFYSTPGYCTEYLPLYLATDLVPGRLYAEDTEIIKLVPTPISQVEGLITSGAICDGKSIAGLLYYLRYKRKT